MPKPKTKGKASVAQSARRAQAIVSQLRTMGSSKDLAGMARFGINVEDAFGVPVYELRAFARRLGKDHALALALWATGNHEARLLACFVDDADAVTPDQLEHWASDFDSWDICDQATTSLFDRTKHAWSKARAWSTRDSEWVKRGGFSLMAGLAVHDKQANDGAFLRLLPLIERGAFDHRNFVKKSVSWALRNIGKRNRALNTAAIRSAKEIRSHATAPGVVGRSGAPNVRAARWVAADALRELGSEKVHRRFASRAHGRGKPRAPD